MRAVVREPTRYPLIHIAATQIEVARLGGDPLPVGREIQVARRILVAAQRAHDRDEAVADEAVLEVARRRGGGGGDGVAGDALGQGNRAARIGLAGETVAALPVLVQEGAVAQVGDAGAAHLAEPAEGGGVKRLAEDHIDPIADPFERRAMVGRSEKDELLELAPPRVARRLGVETGAAGDEAAHAVADDDEVFDLDRPGGDQRLQRLGEGAAVQRDVQAGIVGERDRRIAEVAGERRAMVVVLARPLQVAHAEPVHEHGELAGRVGKRFGERLPFQRQRLPVAAKAHAAAPADWRSPRDGRRRRR